MEGPLISFFLLCLGQIWLMKQPFTLGTKGALGTPLDPSMETKVGYQTKFE